MNNNKEIAEDIYRSLYNKARTSSFESFMRFSQDQMPEYRFFLTRGQLAVLNEIKRDFFVLTRIPYFRIAKKGREGKFFLMRGVIIYTMMTNTTASDSDVGYVLSGMTRETVQYWLKRIRDFMEVKDPCLTPYLSILEKKYDENAI